MLAGQGCFTGDSALYFLFFRKRSVRTVAVVVFLTRELSASHLQCCIQLLGAGLTQRGNGPGNRHR